MSSATPCSHPHRHPARAVATLLALVIGAATAADKSASATPASPSQRLQQRFTAAVEGWRKAVLKRLDAKDREAQLVRELRVVVAPTSVPLLSMQRRLAGHTVVVSAGWLALLDELLRAEAVSPQEGAVARASAPAAGVAHPGADCLSDYAPQVLRVVSDNRIRAAETPPRPLQAWPRLASLVGSGTAPPGCAHLTRTDLQRLGVQARVDDGADAAALWLLTRQAALLAALPMPPAAAASAAAAEDKAAAPADEVTLRLRPPRSAMLFLAPPPYAASTPLTPTAGSISARAVASPPKIESAERRAQQALNEYGLAQPRALRWLRENAALFDPETAVLEPSR